MIEWEKPSGAKIKLNDEKATTEKAKSLGWVKSKPKRGNTKPKED